jgi:SHS family lactate transporter-like MFS transporter
MPPTAPEPSASRPFGFLLPQVPLERREIGILTLFAVVALTQGWSGATITHALPFVREDFDLSDGEVFEVLAIVRGMALIALPFAWWGDRRGRRLPLLVAFFLLPAFNLATTFAPNPAGFIALQSAARIGNIALATMAIVMLSEELRPLVRAYGLAVSALFASIGTGLGLLLRLIGEASDEAWRLLFALSSIPLLALPFLILRLRESRAYGEQEERAPLREVFRSQWARYFWPMAGISMALSSFTGPAANLALIRMENDLGWSSGAASLLLALTSAPGVTLGLLAGGRLADRVGRRPTEVAAAFIGVAGGVTFYFSTIPWLMGLGIFVSMVGAFGFSPAFGSHRSELFPTGIRATAGAWLVNANIIGGLLGFMAGRWVVDAWGIPLTMAALGGVLLAATSLVALVPETRGRELTEVVASAAGSGG